MSPDTQKWIKVKIGRVTKFGTTNPNIMILKLENNRKLADDPQIDPRHPKMKWTENRHRYQFKYEEYKNGHPEM